MTSTNLRELRPPGPRTVYRIGEHATGVSAERPAKQGAPKGMRTPFSTLPTPQYTLRWQSAVLTASFVVIAVLAWRLREAQTESLWLRQRGADLSTLAQESIGALTRAQKQLLAADDEKFVLHRFLDAAGEAEMDLRDDVSDLRRQNAADRRSYDLDSQSWLIQNATLQVSLATESSQREQAEQLSLQWETESRKLSGDVAELQGCVQRLREENADLVRSLREREVQLASLENENSSLRVCNSRLQCEVRDLRSTICGLEGKIACLERELVAAHRKH